MVILGIFYLVEGAEFLGIVQIFVYTGAVMMLFLFVLMLVGVDSSDSLVETIKGQRWVGLLLGLGLVILLVGAVGDFTVGRPVGLDPANAAGNITGIAKLIFGQYVWAFEVTSALLITAAARRDGAGPPGAAGLKVTQRAASQRRFAEAGTTRPGCPRRVSTPGTTPSTPRPCCPDGTPAEPSVSRVLTARAQNLSARRRSSEATAAIEREVEEGRQR